MHRVAALSRLVSVHAALLLTPAALGAAPTGSDHPAEDEVAELISAELLDGASQTPVHNRDRWALRDLLVRDFAQTREVRAQVRLALDPLRQLRDPRWLEELERRAALAQLRPSSSHEAAKELGVAYDIPLADHQLVDAYIDYFTGRGRWFFERWLERSGRYIPMMQPILEEHGLPKDLVYLAMIESGFSAKALSVAAAAGYWQFIRSTAQLFGMKMDTWVDERRDFVTATHSAARYLSRLYAQFGDWHLAWASYNGGEGRVRRTLARTGAKSFWELVELNALPKETQHYVPKIIAAAIVAKNRERYGFGHVKDLQPLTYDELEVRDSIDLRLLAKELGCSAEHLRELNPQFIYDLTPPGRRLRLRVPVGAAISAQAWLDSLPPSQRFTYGHHTVARGDTLSGIANRFGTSIAMIQELNDVRDPRSLRPGQRLIIPSLRKLHDTATAVSVAGAEQQRSAPRAVHHPAAKSKPQTIATSNQPHAKHVVVAGETLWSISRRYGATVEQVRSWNGLRGNELRAGAVLKIYGSSGS